MSLTPVQPAKMSLWAGRSLAMLGILFVAFNLRSAVASVSPIIDRLEAEIPLNTVILAILGMLPPICFAIFGLLAPNIVRKVGVEASVVIAMIAITLGLFSRGLISSPITLLISDSIVFAGIGIGNVLLPPIVKRYFPDRIGLVTTIYAVAMSVSTFVPPLVAVGVADTFGWRASLGMWGFVALIAVFPWLALIINPRRSKTVTAAQASPGEFRRLIRSPIAWSMAIMFSVSGLIAYSAFAWLPHVLRDLAGVNESQAGALLSLFALMGLPASLIVPIIATRFGRSGLLVAVAAICQVAGLLGILFWPAHMTWLWVVLLGLGPLTFPLALVLINLRTETQATAVSLSGFVQSVGYVIVAGGPFLFGLLRDATGSWTASIVFLLIMTIPAIIAGSIAARPRTIEDERAQGNANPATV